jgi:zinc protease
MKVFILCFLFSLNVSADFISDHIEKLNWNGVEVVWLKSDSLPTYSMTVYFNDGALTDSTKREGETELMFDMLTMGTDRYSQAQIADNLEYFGTSYSSSVTHEYSQFSVGGLVKDIVPTMKMFCHLFQNATYPKSELSKIKKRIISSLKNLVTNPSSVAERVFRSVTLQGTPYDEPMGGTIQSVRRIRTSHLRKRLKHFNKNVYKKIYITGPSDIKLLSNVIKNDCEWSAVQTKPKTITDSTPKNKPGIYFVELPKANQVQVRVGRYLNSQEADGASVEEVFSAGFLGGGFTSKLMEELRVKRGLTYSVSAFAVSQKNYGRAVISTFTKNETIVDMLKVITETLNKSSQEIQQERLEHSKRQQKGRYLLSLESNKSYLSKLMYLDHIGKDYSEIYQFPKNVDKLTKKEVSAAIEKYFGISKQVILLAGSKKILPSLKKAGYKVKKLRLQSFL